MKSWFRRAAGAFLLLIVVVATALRLHPPELLRVGSGYAAKMVCSNVFVAGRDPDDVLEADVQAPGIWLLHLVHVSVDRDAGTVHAGFLGFIADGLAAVRPGTGCAVIPDGHLDFPRRAAQAATPTRAVGAVLDAGAAPWPEGDAVSTVPAIQAVLGDGRLVGPGMRAIVVVDHGRIVGERYAAGFTAQTPQLGWSMAKSVTAGLIGMLVKDGKLSLDQAGFWPAAPGDGRDRIRVADLLAMSSGLRFNEQYGDVSDVTRMLFLEADMAGFARAQPLEHPIGQVWSYSSGTAIILSRIVQDAAGTDSAAFADRRLFQPLGMKSAVFETDAHGTPVGSSYLYATARDWARYGMLLAQDGNWQGQELLPRGYVAMMATPVAGSGGQYGMGQVWVYGSDPDPAKPGVNPDVAFGIPPDTFWMSGHDGQNIAIIRSRQLVIVRLGLTPHVSPYAPQPLVKALLEATPTAP
jgi:CubicO group peptidase (beta-lactamase class C family)